MINVRKNFPERKVLERGNLIMFAVMDSEFFSHDIQIWQRYLHI